MNGWEIENILDTLQEAKDRKTKVIKKFLENYSLSASNHDYSQFLVIRKFKVTGTDDNRFFMNCEPSDQNYQYGITIATLDKGGATETRVFIPNNYKYHSLTLENDDVKIETSDFTKITNISELTRKGFLVETPDEIQEFFDNLNNQKFEPVEKKIVKLYTISDNILGNLEFNEEVAIYESNILINDQDVNVKLEYVDEENFSNLLLFSKNFISSGDYRKYTDTVCSEMLELKNESWLEENNKMVTQSKFNSAIHLSTIHFNEDNSVQIIFDDGDMFWGHSILVEIDKNGRYAGSTLVG